MNLTERKIENLATGQGSKDRLVFDDVQRGLAVRVTASGGRSYLCQYTLHGHKWRIPLGACSAVPLASARQAAAAVMGDVAKGRNPAADRKAATLAERAKRARNRLTLRVLIDDWDRLHLSERRSSYAAEAVRALHAAFPDQLDQAAEDLDRTSVIRALDALSRGRKESTVKKRGTAMAGRTAAYGRAAFAWSLKRGAVHHNPFAELPIPKSVTKRERVLGDQELAEIWRASQSAAEPYGSILRLLILTGQRRGEVAGMLWNELSGDFSTWTMPSERTKNGVKHIVPLSAPARDLLKSLSASGSRSELALPGAVGTRFSGWSRSKRGLDKAISDSRARKDLPPFEPWSVHDLRRTVATGLQRFGVRLEVTEAILNHVSGSRGGIAGIYQRHDWATEKRAALESWAKHVISLGKGQAVSGKVLRITPR
jgi:integrase